MKIKHLPLIIFVLLTNTIFGQQTVKAFFVGNSYTAVNNLPQLVANAAQSAGDSLVFNSNLMGGATLQGHSTNTNTLEPIQTGDWDFVILQEQSQRPSFPLSQVQVEVFPYAQALSDSIKKYQPCAETMFYMTWGRQNGDANNCPFWPPICTYEGMDSLLRLRYEMMANMNDAELAPVGAVWRYLRNNHPTINLYTADESHPSAAGSYAAACTFYTTMFRKNPTAITFDYSLSAADALAIRNAVKVTVFDDLLAWNVGAYEPMASFTFTTQDSADFNFNNNSLNGDSYFWDFGDGNSSTLENPSSGYGNFGTYIVTLSVFNNCGDVSTVSDTLQAYVVSTNPIFEDQLFQLTPNPTDGIVHVQTVINDYSIKIYNTNGQLILASKAKELDLTNQPSGIYFINIEFDGKRIQKQILKN